MNGRDQSRVLRCAAGAALAAAFTAPQVKAEGLSGSLTAISDYVYRGLSQTRGRPTVQAGLSYEFGDGFSAGAWGSGIDFGDGKSWLETDYSATYATTWQELGIALGGVYYAYPTSPGAWKYGYFEGWIGLSHDFGPFALNGSVYYSPEFFGIKQDAWYLQTGATVPINNWLSAAGNLGYQTVNQAGYFGSTDSYTHWDLGLTASHEPLALTVMYTQTDLPGSSGDPRVVASLTASF